jgi:hypothetical protein
MLAFGFSNRPGLEGEPPEKDTSGTMPHYTLRATEVPINDETVQVRTNSTMVAKAPQSGKLWRAVESFLSMRSDECRYRWNRPGPNLCKEWLQAFAGKMECGCVRAKSAIEEARRPSTGFKR